VYMNGVQHLRVQEDTGGENERPKDDESNLQGWNLGRANRPPMKTWETPSWSWPPLAYPKQAVCISSTSRYRNYHVLRRSVCVCLDGEDDQEGAPIPIPIIRIYGVETVTA